MSALILVSELAGSYDLLVPSMLAVGVAFVALRRRSLYESQPLTRRDSPVHQTAAALEMLPPVRVADLLGAGRPFRVFEPRTPTSEVVAAVAEATWQHTFPVLEGAVVPAVVLLGGVAVVCGSAGSGSWRWMIRPWRRGRDGGARPGDERRTGDRYYLRTHTAHRRVARPRREPPPERSGCRPEVPSLRSSYRCRAAAAPYPVERRGCTREAPPPVRRREVGGTAPRERPPDPPRIPDRRSPARHGAPARSAPGTPLVWPADGAGARSRSPRKVVPPRVARCWGKVALPRLARCWRRRVPGRNHSSPFGELEASATGQQGPAGAEARPPVP
jgi:hypothetical protein